MGLLQFNESFYRPSQVHFSIDKKRIYEFQVAHERFDPLLKMILRLYGGEIYTDFVSISENQLAIALRQTIGEIEIQLRQLHELQLLVYQPTKDTLKSLLYCHAKMPIVYPLTPNCSKAEGSCI